MARKISNIQASIINNIASTPELASLLLNNSKRAIWRLFTYIQSVAISTLEQIMDDIKVEIENIVDNGVPGTKNWLVANIFKFQYSTVTPQIIQLIDLVPRYTIIDETLRIITRCGVVTTLNNNVLIKVAKSEPPVALSINEVSSLQSYVNTIGVAGVNYIVQSYNSDKISIEADIFYDGQYNNVIKQDVILGINNLLARLSFDGYFKVSDIELAIRSVAGVNDVILKGVIIRQDGQVISQGIYLIQNSTTISRTYTTVSGYLTEETTSTFTFLDTLNFIPQ